MRLLTSDLRWRRPLGIYDSNRWFAGLRPDDVLCAATLFRASMALTEFSNALSKSVAKCGDKWLIGLLGASVDIPIRGVLGRCALAAKGKLRRSEV